MTKFWRHRMVPSLLAVLTLALSLGVGLTAPPLAYAQNGALHQFTVVGDDGEPITSGRCRFLTAGANTNLTLYTTRQGATTKTNPVTLDTTLGVCEAYLPTATNTIDLIVYVDGGSYKGSIVRADAVSRTTKRKIVVGRSSPLKVLVVPFSATASTSTTTTTYTLPPGSRVTAAIVETTTAVAASTFNVNVAGVQGSLCSAASTAAVGFAACNLDGNAGTVIGSSSAITYHNQNHASAGFAEVFYVFAGNEP